MNVWAVAAQPLLLRMSALLSLPHRAQEAPRGRGSLRAVSLPAPPQRGFSRAWGIKPGLGNSVSCPLPSLNQSRGTWADPLVLLTGQSPGGPRGHPCPSDRATYTGVRVWPCTPKTAGQDMERDQDRMWGLGGHWEGAQGRHLRECGEGPGHDLELEGGKPGWGYRDNPVGRIRDRM